VGRRGRMGRPPTHGPPAMVFPGGVRTGQGPVGAALPLGRSAGSRQGRLDTVGQFTLG
jgi:hypothetical protein